MREPSLNEKPAAFLKIIVSKLLENANGTTPSRLAFGGATPQQNFLLQFLILRTPVFQLSKKKILFRRSALSDNGCVQIRQFHPVSQWRWKRSAQVSKYKRAWEWFVYEPLPIFIKSI
ncbi:MAG: hypothetical protein AAB595_02895 [Patescibacteria group bacterium]